MKIYYSSKFEREYKRLSVMAKKRTEIAGKLFRQSYFHPKLKTHKLSGRLKDYWAFSIDIKYRIIFEFYKKDTIWFHSIGDHSIYK